MEEALGPFHVPQHSRRVKLRITPPTSDPNSDNLHSYLFSDPPQQHNLHISGIGNGNHGTEIIAMSGPALPDQNTDSGIGTSIGGLNLSLATHARAGQQFAGGGQRSCGRSTSVVTVATTPIGPFTGYASILSRSRFLKPAEELLQDFCGVSRAGGVSDLGAEKARVLEASFGENWSQKVADRCGDSNLLSMLHEVYKRYKLYHQQMQSAVSSFETVAGLANAAPFICFAIKAVSKHFHCLKKAILDYINFTNTGSGSDDFRNSRDSSGGFSADRSHYHEQRPQHQQLQYRGSMQHPVTPVWRSQRGFPEKAVAVLRTWLFENFLHPYPTDTDKEMLARRTGLSRSQVSNWFTNARVRLWKPMVEEIHTLEKQSHFPTESERRKFVNVLADHFTSVTPNPPEKDSEINWLQKVQDSENRHNSQAFPLVVSQVNQMQQSQLPCSIMSSNHHLIGPGKSETDKHSSSSSAYGPTEENTMGLTWSSSVPFWLAK